MRKRGSASIGSYVPFLLFVVCLGVVAIGSGYFLGKYLMSSLSSLKTPAAKDKPPIEEAEKPPVVAEFSARGMSLQRVQAGVFNVKANAEKRVSELEKAGIPAAITGTGPYRVVVSLLPSQEAANRVALSVKSKGIEVMVNKYVFEDATLKTNGDQEYNETIRSVVETSWDALDRSLKAVDSFILGRQADTKGIIDSTGQVNSVKAKLEASKVPAGGEAVHKGASELVTSAADALQSLTVAASSGQPGPSVLGDVTRAVLAYERSLSAMAGD